MYTVTLARCIANYSVIQAQKSPFQTKQLSVGQCVENGSFYGLWFIFFGMHVNQ